MHSKLVLVLLGILVLFFAWGVVGFFRKMQITAENRRIVENKVAELLQQKEKLTSGIEKLKTEEGKEESIREKQKKGKKKMKERGKVNIPQDVFLKMMRSGEN